MNTSQSILNLVSKTFSQGRTVRLYIVGGTEREIDFLQIKVQKIDKQMEHIELFVSFVDSPSTRMRYILMIDTTQTIIGADKFNEWVNITSAYETAGKSDTFIFTASFK